jgi:UDP-glucose 4-epimerase
LIEHGYDVTVIDSLYKGRKELVDKQATFYQVNTTDFVQLEKILVGKKFDVIMHFASYKDAGESMVKPEMYQDNIVGLMNILKL